MNKKILCIVILSILLIASISTQAVELSKDTKNEKPFTEQSDDKVKVNMGFVVADEDCTHLYGNIQGNLLINVGNGATVIISINYFICTYKGAMVEIKFEDEYDITKINQPGGEYYGTLEIEQYFEPDEDFSVIINTYTYDGTGHGETYKAFGKTCYHNTNSVNINAGFLIIKGGAYNNANPGLILYPNNNFNVNVGYGANIDVTLDYFVNCYGMWDWGELGFGFKGESKKYVQTSHREFGRLTVNKYFNQDELFELEMYGYMHDPLAGDFEETRSIYGSTKPYLEDLNCKGSLKFNRVKPGSTLKGSFIIENIGSPYSDLDWEIHSHPDWGTWTFSQKQGTNLNPEDDAVKIDVKITAPNQRAKYAGKIVVLNKNNPDDFNEISVILSNTRTRQINNLFGNSGFFSIKNKDNKIDNLPIAKTNEKTDVEPGVYTFENAHVITSGEFSEADAIYSSQGLSKIKTFVSDFAMNGILGRIFKIIPLILSFNFDNEIYSYTLEYPKDCQSTGEFDCINTSVYLYGEHGSEDLLLLVDQKHTIEVEYDYTLNEDAISGIWILRGFFIVNSECAKKVTITVPE